MKNIVWSNILYAILMVESGGREDAVGDGGRAIGPLQIHYEVVRDVNRLDDTMYRHADCRSTGISLQIAKAYLQHYAVATMRGHITPMRVAERCARIWNGGPRGMNKPETTRYWEKVRARLPTEWRKT